ncbi:cytochrome c-type biogenesis CcmF C-terminal domain-containing protein [Nonomuraea sp. NPDC049504]|uniref:heme lyase CcmF/NrfE family subunit n=1 Tax=Nonomuraea sp. NPDC049504 TaxID=3154729 RepID=UPI00342D181B
MINLLGTAALWSGLAASLLAALTWPCERTRTLAARGTTATLGAALLAFLLLETALVTHDFAVEFVARHGGRHVPLYYTITSLWSALEGSLVLWLLILTAVTAAVARARDPLQPVAMTVVMLVCAAFFALTALVADPFVLAGPVPADGPGPNPLLRGHPLMGVHPPLLYLGFAALMAPFAYGVACLVTGDTAVARIRTWTLAAWIPLTAGIVLGAWWSYGVLGWGGYWEWDPVENASLMPWLLATALLHATRTRSLSTWTTPLAVGTFLLVLLGTFLTRSGAVASVHSFTRSQAGPALLALLTVALVGAGGLLAWRGREPQVAARQDPLIRLGCALLTVLAGTVLLGTLFPAISGLLGGEQVSVGPPYYDGTVVPGLLALVVLMGAGTRRPSHDLILPAGAGAATIACLGFTGRHSLMALITFGVAAFALAAIARRLLGPARERLDGKRVGGLLAHTGVALAAVAIAASTAYAEESQGRIQQGHSLQAGGYSVRLDGIERQRSADAMTATARVSVIAEGRIVDVMRPSLAFYPSWGGAPVARPAVRSGPAGDLYLSVTEIDQAGDMVMLRVAVNPLMGMLWASGGLIALGGVLALRGGRVRARADKVPAA